MMEDRHGFQEPSSNGRPDSSSSSAFASAACSPRGSIDNAVSCVFSESIPTSPVNAALKVDSLAGVDFTDFSCQFEDAASEDFDFSARFSEVDQVWLSNSMSSADELFWKGQIRPLWYTEEDLHHSFPEQFAHADDDRCNSYYFRSSADYNFTMLSLQEKYASALDAHGFSRRYYDHQLCTVKMTDDVGGNNSAHKVCMAQTIAENIPKLTFTRQDVGLVAKPAVKVKVEGRRGRLFSGGSIRRTRSLSPLRVFHMDDDFPKQLIENQSVKALEDFNVCKFEEHKQNGEGYEIPTCRARVTLKELLHANEKIEHEFASKKRPCLISKHYRNAEPKSKVSNCKPKSWAKEGLKDGRSARNQTCSVQSPGFPYGRHYSPSNVHSEGMRRQTFLPYKHGLLACLGFSKSYRSVAGMRSFLSKSQGMR